MLASDQVKTGYLLTRALLLILVLCFAAFAIGNEVDLTFNAVPSKDLSSIGDGRVAIQLDGKIIVYGAFQVVNGVSKLRIARLNSDGTLDNSFNYNPIDFGSLTSVLFQADGKILVAGAGAFGGAKVVRLNSDGVVDGAFATSLAGGFQVYASTVYAVQSDGKIFAATHSSGIHLLYTTLYRLNADGSTDNSFAPMGFEGWTAKEFLRDLVLLPGGQILIAGKHPNGYVFRVNTNGTKDNTFESPLLGNGPQVSLATSIALQSDGKVLFTGTFATVNGLFRTNLTRLNADGTLDLSFAQSIYNGTVRVLSNGQLFVGEFRRLNSDGSLDNTFNPPGSLASVGNWVIDGMDRVVLFGGISEVSGTEYKYARLNSDGSYDLSFTPTARLAGTVNLLVATPDNKIIVTGDFTRMNEVLRSNLARLNPDGTLDPTFDVGTGFNATPLAIAVQGDGKVLAGGGFSLYNGAAQANLARVNSNGGLDAGFSPIVGATVYSIAIQTDGKILIGGDFSTVNGVTQKRLARLNSNGSLDATFSPIFSAGTILSIVVQGDGKIVFGGSFSGVSGVARTNMARLNSDGSVDTSFNAGSILSVDTIVIQPDGKYLANWGESFKRLNVDGSTDNTFQSPVMSNGSFSRITRAILQSDGSIVIGGNFSAVNGVSRPNLARVTSTGAIDVAFIPAGTNYEINDLLAQPGGKIVVSGIFTMIDNVVRLGIARINTVPVAPIVRVIGFDYDGDGKADVSVFRPSNSYWYISRSSDFQFAFYYFGTAGDLATPGDYDGDRKTDIAIFRPSSGDWWYQSSITGVFTFAHFGANGDIPRPSDFDGDGRTDFIVYRPAEGNWYRLSSATGQWSQRNFGAFGDKPLVGDFDGDGKSDPAIFRPSTGVFWYMSSIDSVHRSIKWGSSADIPVPADYDGDGKTDAAVYRPSNGTWYILNSSNGSYYFPPFGIAEDKPVPADYDGDGKDDVAVYRPSTGTWYILRSTAGFTAQQFGNSTDVPTPNAFVP